MASYHFAMQIIGRSKGRSVVAAAAYRAGARLTDPRTGEIHNYSQRKGIAHSEILLPEGAAPWLADRQRLWATVEEMEKRKDAQLARELNIALPHELDAADRLALLRDFVRSQFVSEGMVADIAIHEPAGEWSGDQRNHHAHVLLTLRQATPEGLWRVKTRDWNSDAALEGWRAAWAEHQNRWLEFRGWDARVDHRTLIAQREAARTRGDEATALRLARTPEIHVGPRARIAEGEGRTPPSRDREARSKFNRPRTRTYARQDFGSRVHYLAHRIERNLTDLEHRLTRWQRKLSRFQTRQRWLTKAEFETRRERERLEREKTWLRRKEREEAIRALTRRQSHYERRLSQTDVLLRGIDNMLRSLVGLQSVQTKRRHFVRDLGWGRGQGAKRTQSRGRGRTRRRTPA